MESHNILSYPWGHYANLHDDNVHNYKVRKVLLQVGKKISLQSHKTCCKHWITCAGSAKVQLEDKFIILSDNAHVFIPIDAKHSIENVGDQEIEFIEITMGDSSNEENIVFYED